MKVYIGKLKQYYKIQDTRYKKLYLKSAYVQQ